MGEVYRATDSRLGRDVALKLLLPVLAEDAEVLRRFRQEPRAAAALNHPGVCTVYDVGEWAGRPYFTMEFLEGKTLRQRIEEAPLAFDELLSIAAAVGDAIGAAHSKGILHRDLKPANIFVTNTGQVKVVDFGLAKQMKPSGASSLTRPGAAIGTVAYMSPEQVRGEDLDTRSDLFSLGIVLYEMATGQPAFPGNDSLTIAAAILTGSVVPPCTLNPQLPRSLDAIIAPRSPKGSEPPLSKRYGVVRRPAGVEAEASLKPALRGVASPARLRVRRGRSRIDHCRGELRSQPLFCRPRPTRVCSSWIDDHRAQLRHDRQPPHHRRSARIGRLCHSRRGPLRRCSVKRRVVPPLYRKMVEDRGYDLLPDAALSHHSGLRQGSRGRGLRRR
jgi:serine/threonine protein kinase